MLDHVAQRYGTLPSILMREGNTFDFYVADLSTSYQNYLYKKENGGSTTAQPSEVELFEMMKRARALHDDGETES